MADMDQKFQMLANEIASIKNENQTLIQQIQSLRANAPSPRQSTAQNIPTPTPKVPVNKPEEYKGDRSKTLIFLEQCKLVFETQPNIYTSDQVKVNYAASYLRDNAFHWYINYKAKLLFPLTFDLFQKDLIMSFGSQDKSSSARNKLSVMIITFPVWLMWLILSRHNRISRQVLFLFLVLIYYLISLFLSFFNSKLILEFLF